MKSEKLCHLYLSLQRITTSEIIENQWFQTNYEPAVRIECDEDINFDDVHAAFNSVQVITKQSSNIEIFVIPANCNAVLCRKMRQKKRYLVLQVS
jgi:hypothetical protein